LTNHGGRKEAMKCGTDLGYAIDSSRAEGLACIEVREKEKSQPNFSHLSRVCKHGLNLPSTFFKLGFR